MFAWTSRRHCPYVDLSPQLKAGGPYPALHNNSGADRYSDDTISLATYHIGTMYAKAIPIVEFRQLDLKEEASIFLDQAGLVWGLANKAKTRLRITTVLITMNEKNRNCSFHE